MRVTVDASRCACTGTCTLVAPEVFEIQGITLVVLQDEPAESQRAAVLDAAEQCPTEAIHVVD